MSKEHQVYLDTYDHAVKSAKESQERVQQHIENELNRVKNKKYVDLTLAELEWYQRQTGMRL